MIFFCIFCISNSVESSKIKQKRLRVRSQQHSSTATEREYSKACIYSTEAHQRIFEQRQGVPHVLCVIYTSSQPCCISRESQIASLPLCDRKLISSFSSHACRATGCDKKGEKFTNAIREEEIQQSNAIVKKIDEAQSSKFFTSFHIDAMCCCLPASLTHSLSRVYNQHKRCCILFNLVRFRRVAESHSHNHFFEVEHLTHSSTAMTAFSFHYFFFAFFRRTTNEQFQD